MRGMNPDATWLSRLEDSLLVLTGRAPHADMFLLAPPKGLASGVGDLQVQNNGDIWRSE